MYSMSFMRFENTKKEKSVQTDGGKYCSFIQWKKNIIVWILPE